MKSQRKRLLLIIGLWAGLLLAGLLATAAVPSTALADGMTGDPLPSEGSESGSDPCTSEPGGLVEPLLLAYLVAVTI